MCAPAVEHHDNWVGSLDAAPIWNPPRARESRRSSLTSRCSDLFHLNFGVRTIRIHPMTSDELISAAVEQYLGSHDFNGLPAFMLTHDGRIDLEGLRSVLRPLIESGQLSVNFGSVHPNPHIRALTDPPIPHQVSELDSAGDDRFVIYPTAATLAPRVDPREYDGRPYSLRLALGAPQLEFVSFDLAALDHYRRDPRYRLWTNDVQSTLSIGDESFQSPAFPEKHKVLIQSFGFSYSAALKRAVAVFLTDLHRLTPEHQGLWFTFELAGEHKLHPDFWRAAIMGDWELKASLRDAFIVELHTVSAMTQAIGWGALFRNSFEDAPRELALLIRPTVAEFNDFTLVLDKLMSENLNISFFPASISRETEELRDDGKTVVRTRGSVALLEEWLTKTFRTPDPVPLQEAIATFRRVRKLRQSPAHALDPDVYDETLFEKQRLLFVAAYDAVRTLRLVLQNHPRARAVSEEMDERIRAGDIWSF